VYKSTLSTQIGPLSIVADEHFVKQIKIGKEEKGRKNRIIERAESEIISYFSGNLREFTVPVKPEGTEYQKKVWRAIMEIPYGELRAYEWVAQKAGGSPRSVGNALRANPIPIIIPCHRVIRKDGSLGGFSAGLEVKRFLIEHERKFG